MDTLSLLTLHLSRAYGVVILTIALAALLNPARLGAALGDFKRSPGLTLLGGIFALILGVMLIMLHSLWVDVPAILISLLNWAVLIKGVVLIGAPDAILKLASTTSASTSRVRIWGVMALILGALLLAIGLIGRAQVSL